MESQDFYKEMAMWVRELAEEKMESKDFSGALKNALEAQKMYPELENISQLILVCEVHCCAEKVSYGTDKDWYGILKVQPKADEISIQKQYRKLALDLHPDKNKFPGSTDAFKLITAAQRVLLDPLKRMAHDIKRFPVRDRNPTQLTRKSNVQNQHSWNWRQDVDVDFTVRVRPGNFDAPNPFTCIRGYHMLTFWTVCPFCSVRYQFYKDVLNKDIHCQHCKKTFIGHELKDLHSVPTTHTHTHTLESRVHLTPEAKPAEVHKRNLSTTKPVFEKKKETPKAQGNTSRKRKKRIEESSESSESEVEDLEVQRESEDNIVDNDNDNDDTTPANPAEDKRKESSDEKSQNVSKRGEEEEETEPEVFECPDPEFSDFDQYRKEEDFKPGQIWGCYDTEDAMPRFYAFIKKVSLAPAFKLQIQWLKPDPVTLDEKKWVSAELPVACGGFKFEKADKSENLFTFSHLVTTCEAGGQKVKTFNIIPRIGETWALFENWSINWHLLEHQARKYEYEFVEVLSDFDEKEGAHVAYLEKVEGFLCLFTRKTGGQRVIPRNAKYRFAHMVPSCRMSGEERGGVPEGCFELDPAALPASIFE